MGRLATGSGWVLYLALGVFLAGCASSAPLPTAAPLAELPSLSLTPPPTPPLSTPPPQFNGAPAAAWQVWVDEGIPAGVALRAQQLVGQRSQHFTWSSQSQAAIRLELGGETAVARWVYAVVAPFATVADEITLAELQANWQGNADEAPPVLVAAGELPALTAMLGPPGTAVHPVEETDLVEQVWAERPSLAVAPFDQLSPALKVLAIDGRSPLDPALDTSVYPLAVNVSVAGQETAVADFLSAWGDGVTNRDPGKITRVAMTGVTALTRATAYQMELRGVTTPGTAVAPVLAQADVAHVSHEVAFAPDCPYPDPYGGAVFCARDAYLELLQFIGVNVVELTGNHVNDWGADNLVRTIEMYEAAGMATFGGGRDLVHAAEPALFEHNGNRIALVGCNPVGPAFAWAAESRAGSRPCDDDFPAQITALREAGYLVIATLQYHEYYHYAATPQQQRDFRALVDAGATAVSGSQAHHAQGFDLYGGGFIHYGPGNLFFDQMNMLGTRQAFIATYVIYNGRLLSVTLWTGLIEDWCCPREMTGAERAQALTAVFQASGW